MGPSFKASPKANSLGKAPKGGGFLAISLLLSALQTLYLPGPCCPPLTVFSAPTHKMWLPSMLAKLMMGNWDTMGLISW